MQEHAIKTRTPAGTHMVPVSPKHCQQEGRHLQRQPVLRAERPAALQSRNSNASTQAFSCVCMCVSQERMLSLHAEWPQTKLPSCNLLHNNRSSSTHMRCSDDWTEKQGPGEVLHGRPQHGLCRCFASLLRSDDQRPRSHSLQAGTVSCDCQQQREQPQQPLADDDSVAVLLVEGGAPACMGAARQVVSNQHSTAQRSTALFVL